jgi:hypothetical protein
MEGGGDGMRNIWDQGSWQRADIEGWTKATMGWLSPCRMVGLQEFLDGSSSSVPSNMLSLGKTWWTKEDRMDFKDHYCCGFRSSFFHARHNA